MFERRRPHSTGHEYQLITALKGSIEKRINHDKNKRAFTSVLQMPHFPITARPKTKLTDATTLLLDFAIITYAVSPQKLQELLPPSLMPDCFTLQNGQEVAFVSAVPFRDVDFHFHFAPFFKVSMGQTNYRAYVKRKDGTRAVYFFGTTLSGFWVRIPRDWWKLPWKSAQMQFDTTWAGQRLQHYRLSAQSEWGPAELEMTGTQQAMDKMDGFSDLDETATVLTHPLIGYYHRNDGRLGSYSVWHARLDLQKAAVQHASFPVFERLGLIDAHSQPHSALVMPQTEFIVQLPPGLASELEET